MLEPYLLKPSQIAELTDAQIIGLYGRERDDKGMPKPVGPERRREYLTPEDKKANFVNLLRAFGKSEAEAEAVWSKTKGR